MSGVPRAIEGTAGQIRGDSHFSSQIDHRSWTNAIHQPSTNGVYGIGQCVFQGAHTSILIPRILRAPSVYIAMFHWLDTKQSIG